MDPITEYALQQTRRHFFGTLGLRLGGVAMGLLAGDKILRADEPAIQRVHPPLPGLPHFAPKAKSLIY